MASQALAHKINIDRVDLEALDQFLRSDRSPPDSMMLSDLDGFLTGIAVGPEPILPSEWLPQIWGGDAPEFAGMDEAKVILGSLMARYNEILRDIADDALAPIFWEDREGTIIAMDWAEGFLEAVKLRPDAWEPLFASKRYGQLLFPILSLCGDASGASLLGLPPEDEERMAEAAPELIAGCAIGIAGYWRRKGASQASRLNPGPRREPSRAAPKTGRNDPCPCGSGRKLKSCCGQGA